MKVTKQKIFLIVTLITRLAFQLFSFVFFGSNIFCCS